MTTSLQIIVDTGMDREQAMDLRDDIVDALAPLGVRVSWQSGPHITMVAGSVPTVGDRLTGGFPVTVTRPVINHPPA